jgi:hypothetical protein
MKKVLVTGGPVYGYIDDVKIVTNVFKGGRICKLAEALETLGAEVTYLTAPQEMGAKIPESSFDRISVVTHRGFDDYYKKVLELAPHMDGIVLSAAVANLIPAKPIKGKFPSHDYKPGDIVPIDFMIAPRVIDEVKKVAPRAHLFGSKLLSGTSYDELIRAAYGIVLEAKATAVIANDRKSLDQKYVVTKERGVHPMKESQIPSWMWTMLHDEYYSTKNVTGPMLPYNVLEKVMWLIKTYEPHFLVTDTGLIFGTVAVRHGTGFVTTGRGKKELNSIATVANVDHEKRIIYAENGAKASLNAPLLSKMFQNPAVHMIVHYHKSFPFLPEYPYAPPGSVRDSDRPNTTSFNIKEHGCMLLFNQDGKRL